MDPLMQPDGQAEPPTMDFLMDAQSGDFNRIREKDSVPEVSTRRRTSRTVQIGIGILAILLVTLVVLLSVFLSRKGNNSNSTTSSGLADGARGPGALTAPTPPPLRVNTPTPSETTNMPTLVPTNTPFLVTVTAAPVLFMVNGSSLAPVSGSNSNTNTSTPIGGPVATSTSPVVASLGTISPSLTDSNSVFVPTVNSGTASPTTFPTASPSTVTPVVANQDVTSNPTTSPTNTANVPSATNSGNPNTNTTLVNATPELGSVAGVAYYHCPALDTSGNVYHLVLLHGGTFTKENWKKVGILDDLCQYPQLSVSALDLSTSANHEDLKMYLSAMESMGLLRRPVVLVTPSASGYTMVDWFINGANVATVLPQYVETWIPVAVGSLPSASDAQIINALGSTPVLAIYGDQDRAGGKLSNRLGTLVNATVVELPGGHPVYLWSPVEFVDTILKFLGVS